MFLLRLFFLLFSLLSCTATVGEAATVEDIYVQCNLPPSLVQCVNIIISFVCIWHHQNFQVGTLSVPRTCQPGNINLTTRSTRSSDQSEGRGGEGEGDAVVIHVIDDPPYNVTIH
jgi:hypothetical protein